MSWKNKDAHGSHGIATSVATVENDLVGPASDGLLDLACAAVGSAQIALGFAPLKNYAAGERVAVVTSGKIAGVTDDLGAALVVGTYYYLSESDAGKITATKPSTNGDLVQQVGVACSTTELLIAIGPAFVYAATGKLT
jgi:hypothetical protein